MDGFKIDSIIIAHPDQNLVHQISESITQNMTFGALYSVSTLDSLKEQLSKEICDILILDFQMISAASLSIIHEMKLLESSPKVVVLSDSFTQEQVRQLYSAGCDQCLSSKLDDTSEIVVTLRHVSRMKRLEEENGRLIAKLTEANALLADKNKRLDEFSGTVAHDIRGPLGGIAMRLEYIRDVYRDELDQKFADIVEGTLTASRRLIDVVQAMYEYAKLGNHAGNLKEVELVELIQEVVSDIKYGSEKDIKIGLDELPKVWGNPGLLRKIFLNLISNAIKYSDKHSILINIGIHGYKERSFGKFVELFVSDNGPGIPKEEQDKICDMFSRSKRDAAVEGLGIGLAVVKRVVELHFGTFTLDTSYTDGTKFVFSLPVEEIDLSF